MCEAHSWHSTDTDSTCFVPEDRPPPKFCVVIYTPKLSLERSSLPTAPEGGWGSAARFGSYENMEMFWSRRGTLGSHTGTGHVALSLLLPTCKKEKLPPCLCAEAKALPQISPLQQTRWRLEPSQLTVPDDGGMVLPTGHCWLPRFWCIFLSVGILRVNHEMIPPGEPSIHCGVSYLPDPQTHWFLSRDASPCSQLLLIPVVVGHLFQEVHS